MELKSVDTEHTYKKLLKIHLYRPAFVLLFFSLYLNFLLIFLHCRLLYYEAFGGVPFLTDAIYINLITNLQIKYIFKKLIDLPLLTDGLSSKYFSTS